MRYGLGMITLPITQQEAVTRYSVAHVTPSARYGFISTVMPLIRSCLSFIILPQVDLWPETGRRHQLRKHLAQNGHAIIGDQRYATSLDW
jgi:23S rRNA-/tRNA-specific pseudouridylate synthase